MKNKFALLDSKDSVLVVIDVQDLFLKNLGEKMSERLVDRICWLVQVARWLKIPIVVTAEDVANDGPTNAKIRSVLTDDSPDLDKVVFGLTGQKDIMEQVQQTNRKTAVLVGMETDVCVQHSAFGLAESGFEVAVVTDATASPGIGHEVGIDRLRDAGVKLVSTKSLFFEWMRDLEKWNEFCRDSDGLEKTIFSHQLNIL